jgi:hypothetical protein
MSNRGMKKGGKQSLYLTIFEWQLPEIKHAFLDMWKCSSGNAIQMMEVKMNKTKIIKHLDFSKRRTVKKCQKF